MLQIETVDIPHNDVVREVTDAILRRVGRTIAQLTVACDGEVITVRGVVGTYYLWQLAYSAARSVSNRFDGLLLDYQIQTVPAQNVT